MVVGSYLTPGLLLPALLLIFSPQLILGKCMVWGGQVEWIGSGDERWEHGRTGRDISVVLREMD